MRLQPGPPEAAGHARGVLRASPSPLALQVREGCGAALAAAGRVAQGGRARARLCGESRRVWDSSGVRGAACGAPGGVQAATECRVCGVACRRLRGAWGSVRGHGAYLSCWERGPRPAGPAARAGCPRGPSPRCRCSGPARTCKRRAAAPVAWRAGAAGQPGGRGSYQRPSALSSTTSSTSPLLTARAAGPVFSRSAVAVYVPGTCGAPGKGQGGGTPPRCWQAQAGGQPVHPAVGHPR